MCAGLLLFCTGCYNKARSGVSPASTVTQTQEYQGAAVTEIAQITDDKLQSTSAEQSQCAYRVFFDEAQCVDIPLPDKLIFWHRETLADSRRHILKYTVALPAHDIAAFYRVHMEYVGWQEREIFTGSEHCLVFKKPSRVTVITIAIEREQTCVTIFTGPRKK